MDDDTRCSICLEEWGTDTQTVTVCNHRFHQQCLEPWLDQHHSCPICRETISSSIDSGIDSISGDDNEEDEWWEDEDWEEESRLFHLNFQDREITQDDVKTQFQMLPQLVDGHLQDLDKNIDGDMTQWRLAKEYVMNIIRGYVFQEIQQGGERASRVKNDIEHEITICRERIHELGSRAHHLEGIYRVRELSNMSERNEVSVKNGSSNQSPNVSYYLNAWNRIYVSDIRALFV